MIARYAAAGAAMLAALLWQGEARAVTFGASGYADIRLVLPAEEKSWMDGGLGKVRYGEGSSPEAHLGEIVGEAHLLLTGEIMAQVVARIEPAQRTFVDVLEAYVRYRPVSLNQWRYTFKAGAFFPPISLENTELGWASPWTLTPSAINTWVGEELRTVGAEAKAEWRGEARTLSLTGAFFGFNDPAGILLADRGWAFGDRLTGFYDRPRLPDVFARSRRVPAPLRTFMFIETDNVPGWYAAAAWEEKGIGRLEVLRYDNAAKVLERHIQPPWATDFWSVGLRTDFGSVTLLAQGMTGTTFFQPSATFFSSTDFHSAYLLAGWDIGEWRVAGRFDVFDTEETRSIAGLTLSEHGHAFDLSVNYLPSDWMRVTVEALQVASTRAQRTMDGLPAEAANTTFQISTKFFF